VMLVLCCTVEPLDNELVGHNDILLLKEKIVLMFIEVFNVKFFLCSYIDSMCYNSRNFEVCDDRLERTCFYTIAVNLQVLNNSDM